MITIDNKKVTDITIGNKVVYRIVDQETDEVIFEKTAPQIDYFYIENTYNGTNTITITTERNWTSVPSITNYATSLQYSKDKTNWTGISLSPTSSTNYGMKTNTITLSQGEKVYFRNTNGYFNWINSSSSDYYFRTKFTASQAHVAGGNINSLFNYQNMSSVTLPSVSGCLNELFHSNTTLTSAANLTLPATRLYSEAYRYMFYGCTALTSAPQTLPATTSGNTIYDRSCYNNMFGNCSSLTSAPTSVTMSGHQSCSGMFSGCTSLRTPPSLPNTTLFSYCYSGMFEGCSALTSAPTLPATTLAQYCYSGMFANCTNLTSTPILPATTLVGACYRMMFYGCSSLNTVTTYANDISATDCRYNWLSGVANRGTFYNYGNAVYPSGAQGIPTNWTEMGGLFRIKNRYNGTNTITVNVRQNGTPTSGTYATSVDYSKDGSSWTTLNLSSTGTKTISMSSGQTVYFRNSSGNWSWYDNTSNRRYISFYCNQNFEVGGHLASLVDYTNLNVTIPQGSFHLLFYKSSTEGNMSDKLLSSSKLILPNPGAKAFVGMFNGCINMTDCPTLPTTTTTACFDTMFSRCRSLTTAPALPSTSLEFACYRQMFYNNISLTTAPELPATTLAEQCYKQMFQGCTSLNSVTIYADDNSASQCTNNWLDSVASTGTLHNLGSATYTADSASGIPTGWTEVYV